jgi:hypothetical protein
MRASPIAIASATATAAAAAAVWYGVAGQGGGGTGGSGAAPSGGAEPVAAAAWREPKVCVGSDRILRATLADGQCPPGNTPLRLDSGDDGLCELCDPFGDPSPPDAGGDPALDAIERRVRALENAAYFEVVDENERPIFRVGPGGVGIFNEGGAAVAAIGTSAAGAYFTARSATKPIQASIGASGTTAGIRILEDGVVNAELAMREGRSALRFPSGNGLIAGIGESSTGAGALYVGTRKGEVRASFTVSDDRGLISVSNEKVAVATLGESPVGGGLLDIGDSAGNLAARMGHVENRYGIVMTFPIGLPLVPRAALPGSYFMGCSSGRPPACAPAVP